MRNLDIEFLKENKNAVLELVNWFNDNQLASSTGLNMHNLPKYSFPIQLGLILHWMSDKNIAIIHGDKAVYCDYLDKKKKSKSYIAALNSATKVEYKNIDSYIDSYYKVIIKFIETINLPF